jgi:integrase
VMYSTVNQRLRSATTELGVKGFTSHSLRHQFASDTLANGMPLVELSELLGHSDPSITMRVYAHAMPDAQDRTRELMNARWGIKAA